MEQLLEIPSWDELFMRHAYLISSKSKDTSTKIGAIIVKDNRYIISEGFNGLPIGVNDNIEERYQRPFKYNLFEHAERNSIYQCARQGIITKGTVMFTQGIPCTDCARAVIQAGIKEVIVHKQWEDSSNYLKQTKWLECAKISQNGWKVRRFLKLCLVNLAFQSGYMIKF